MDKYKGITDYLKYISENFDLEICINDFAGFLYMDDDLAAALQPYLIHRNKFCMQVKSNRELMWQRCLQMKRGMLLKAEKLKKTYYGMCYCGMEEYIVPIICVDVVIGVICTGEFSTHRNISLYRISKISKQYCLDFESLKESFDNSALDKTYNADLIDSLLGIVSEYLAGIYSTLVSTHENLPVKENKKRSSEHYLLSHALEYIKQNYQEHVTVSDISGFCYCSRSYISHIFKKNMKINVKAYINKVRVEKAKILLLDSTFNIAEISSQVGFSDPNYFSNIFRNICGITPSEYKRRFGEKEHEPSL